MKRSKIVNISLKNKGVYMRKKNNKITKKLIRRVEKRKTLKYKKPCKKPCKNNNQCGGVKEFKTDEKNTSDKIELDSRNSYSYKSESEPYSRNRHSHKSERDLKADTNKYKSLESKIQPKDDDSLESDTSHDAQPKNTHSRVITDSAKIEGSDFVGEGSEGCVVRPSLICEEDEEIELKTVGKVTTSELADEELKSYELIKTLEDDPEIVQDVTKLYLGTPHKCKVTKNEYNVSSLTRCGDKYKNLLEEDKLYLLVMEDGGMDIKNYKVILDEKACKIENKTEAMEVITELINVLSSMTKILSGIKLFIEHGIIHHDLKALNIVYDKEKKESYFIDFGFMEEHHTFIRKNYNGISWEYVHWNFPLETFFYTRSVFDKYIKLPIHKKKEFVTLVTQYSKNKDKIQKISYFDKKLGLEQHSESNTEKLIEAISEFCKDFDETDKSWFISEYNNMYAVIYQSLTKSVDKTKEYVDLKDRSLKTFDIYGVSDVFWNLLIVAQSIQSKVEGNKIPHLSPLSNTLVVELREFARRMSTPDYKKREQIDDLIVNYKEFLKTLTKRLRIENERIAGASSAGDDRISGM
jgi:serine/threonine protein kinase